MNDRLLTVELARQQMARQEKFTSNLDIAMLGACLLIAIYVGIHVLTWVAR